MSTFMFVFSNGVEGREEECNDWYINVHLKEVAAVEGVISAQRFTLTRAQVNEEQEWQYMAMYELDENTGAEQVVKNMLASAEHMNMSDSLDSDNAFVSIMTSISEPVMG